MAYIGKSPSGTGVRQRYYFTATGGETSLSGTDDNGLTLSYSDGAYVDVLLNGIELVAGTDYNTSTANTIAGLSALAASDVVTVTVYDIFTVADTVSAKDGGTFSGNVVMNADLTVDTNTLHVDSTNDRVGIGLSSSIDRKLHVEVDNDYAAKFGGTAGGDFAIEIGQTGASGSAGFNATGTGGAMKFSISGTEAMRIDTNGTLLYGTTSTLLGDNGVRIYKVGSGTGAFAEIANGGSGVALRCSRSGSNGQVQQYAKGTTVVGSVSVTASSTSYATSSDYRLKENDVDMTGAIERVKQLQPKRFNFIIDADTTVDGFMAHEVQTVVPEAITGTHNEVDDEGNPVYQGIDQAKLVPLLTGALKEAIAKIEALETRVQALEDA